MGWGVTSVMGRGEVDRLGPSQPLRETGVKDAGKVDHLHLFFPMIVQRSHFLILKLIFKRDVYI